MEFFCACCGTRTVNNTTRASTGDYLLTCAVCQAGIRFYITLKPSRTLEEAEQIFNETPLTENQQFGSSKRKKR